MKLPKQSTGIQRATGGITAKYVLGIGPARFQLPSPLRFRLRGGNGSHHPPFPRCFCKQEPDPTSLLGYRFIEMCYDATGFLEPTGKKCAIVDKGQCACPPPPPPPPCTMPIILSVPTIGTTQGRSVECRPDILERV